MRQHTTVTITEQFILQYNPCDSGISMVSPHLPMKISTDPNANLKIASLLVSLGRGHDVRWLLLKTVSPYRGDLYRKWDATTEADLDHELNSAGEKVAPYDGEDVFVVMQFLAMLADKIDCDRRC